MQVLRFGDLEIVDLSVFLGRVELPRGNVDGHVVSGDVAQGGCSPEAAQCGDGDVNRTHLD